ncbi:MAG TPA: hypothetical protein VFB90_06210 [Dehalococcoidia bacterium]|nr:hypothetical protein [Dehalococcoidia bacterium]
MPLRLRIDSWTPEYDSAIQIDEGEESTSPVDPFVETEDWQPIAPDYLSRPATIVFIDGVQRVETRVIGDEDGRMVYGAFTSLAVGAALARLQRPAVACDVPERVLALSDGGSSDPISVPCGNIDLAFHLQSTALSGLAGVHEAVNNARRMAETRLGERMIDAGNELVIVDGRLNFQPTRDSMAVGFVKTMHKSYLQGSQLALLSQLGVRARTPLFRIERDRPLYSWYLRLSERRPIEHPWAGLARIETLDSIGLAAAVRLADLTTVHLPDFASTRERDGRAPQNLFPISGLEEQLRHSLGDHEWIRRHIEAYFHREVALQEAL